MPQLYLFVLHTDSPPPCHMCVRFITESHFNHRIFDLVPFDISLGQPAPNSFQLQVGRTFPHFHISTFPQGELARPYVCLFAPSKINKLINILHCALGVGKLNRIPCGQLTEQSDQSQTGYRMKTNFKLMGKVEQQIDWGRPLNGG